MNRKIYYHTTPIYYVNDVPHPGHAYTTLAADALTRARRLRGHNVFFLTGTDEHGQNIARIARERGVPEQAYCDQIAERFQQLWKRLDIGYDDFIRTTQERHRRGVLALWQRLRQARAPTGEMAVYKDRYSGWYCPRCEAFKDEDELKEPDHLCADHERPCEWTEEENYFFRLSAYQEWLRAQIESGALRIEPDSRRNEVLAVVRQGLKDFSISRARVKWGIPIPEEPGHVFYVWVDALSNYVTALGFGDESEAARRRFQTYWLDADERLHLVGKEIIRFHCLYWPALLHAADLPIPTRVFAHGWLTKDGKKLSKTTGNVIDPDALIDRYGVDPFRYFFLREGSFGQDWDFTEEAFRKRYNSDLANDLGNLVSRALTMVEKYCDGRIPEPSAARKTTVAQDPAARPFVDAIFARYDALDFAGALAQVWTKIGEWNQRIVRFAPWEKAKDPQRRVELDTFLLELLDGVRLVGVMVSPVMPQAASRIFGMMGIADQEFGPETLFEVPLEAGRRLGHIEPLFPRLEEATAAQETQIHKGGPVSESSSVPPPPSGAADSGLVDISEFARLDLRVGRVVEAEKIASAKKLLRLQVDLGGERRQVVAGIAESYAPEALVGKTVAVVANLKAAKLMGVESSGMLLAASAGGRAVLCTFEGDVAPGTKIK